MFQRTFHIFQEESGLRSAQGSLVPASSDAVANAVYSVKEVNAPHAIFAPTIPATQHTVMMVAEMPPIPIISEDSKPEDSNYGKKLELIDAKTK